MFSSLHKARYFVFSAPRESRTFLKQPYMADIRDVDERFVGGEHFKPPIVAKADVALNLLYPVPRYAVFKAAVVLYRRPLNAEPQILAVVIEIDEIILVAPRFFRCVLATPDFLAWDFYKFLAILLIDLGNEQQPLDEKYKTESNLIDGCQSRVWLQADYRDGRIFFTAESDALIVKGIIALLIRVLSGHTPQEILDADLYFIDRIGLKDHLSPTRSNGLLAMIKQIRVYALAYNMKG